MEDEVQTKWGLLAAPLILGVLADALLRATPWGLNVTLWVSALVVFILWLCRGKGELWASGGVWLVLPSVLFALDFIWRDSRPLAVLDLFALWVTASLAVFRAQGGRILAAALADYAIGAVVAGSNALLGPPFLVVRELPWGKVFTGRFLGRGLAVGLGILLAVPPTIVFALLFANADPVFAALLKDLFRFNFLTVLSHAFVFGFFAWTSAGLLRGLLIGKELSWTRAVRPPRITLGIVELGVMLGAVILVFLIFVIVQFRYFFGGAGLVQATTGLTYAEYARRGFFELVTASALVLPLLLASHWLLGQLVARAERTFRVLAGVLLALVFVVMVSAFERMRLYQAEYGMTEQRLYTTAFMGWLAVVLIWFALTVLTGRRQRFASGALIAGYVLIVVLHVINPNALIARTNTARARQGLRFDARYAASLGADAVPALVTALPDLAPADRCVVRQRLLERWSSLPAQAGSEPTAWRTWNASRAAARRIVHENIVMLRTVYLNCP